MISFNFLISQVRKLNCLELRDLLRFEELVKGRARTESSFLTSPPLIFPLHQAGWLSSSPFVTGIIF